MERDRFVFMVRIHILARWYIYIETALGIMGSNWTMIKLIYP